jgi:L-amino acid N-acyltransferase YncA
LRVPVTLSPITLREARAFVAAHHRHHRPPQGGAFAVAAADGDRVVGVAIVGHPVARMLADGYTAEVTRLATDGTRNACSMLYAAAWRAARALGYRRLVTYILATESGTSPRASGWRLVGEAGGGTWDRPRNGRPRVDTHPTQRKLRFEVGACP